jgi:2-oxoisovalerate dehydrogenase E1 component beta subunit
MAETTYLEAIRQGLWEEMERDPRVFLIGEDIGRSAGRSRSPRVYDRFREPRH